MEASVENYWLQVNKNLPNSHVVHCARQEPNVKPKPLVRRYSDILSGRMAKRRAASGGKLIKTRGGSIGAGEGQLDLGQPAPLPLE